DLRRPGPAKARLKPGTTYVAAGLQTRRVSTRDDGPGRALIAGAEHASIRGRDFGVACARGTHGYQVHHLGKCDGAELHAVGGEPNRARTAHQPAGLRVG